jgi:hypothetical protein
MKRAAVTKGIDMSDETTKVKKPIQIGSITINADNPDEVILAALRYYKSIRLHNKLLNESER